MIASNAHVIVIGTLLNDVVAYIQAFKQQHYNPKAMIATAGPDQGKQFTDAIGGANCRGRHIRAEWRVVSHDQHLPERQDGQ